MENTIDSNVQINYKDHLLNLRTTIFTVMWKCTHQVHFFVREEKISDVLKGYISTRRLSLANFQSLVWYTVTLVHKEICMCRWCLKN